MRGTKKFQKNKQQRLKKSLRKKGGLKINREDISFKRFGEYEKIRQIPKKDLEKRSLFRKIANTAGIMTVGQKYEMQKKEERQWYMDRDVNNYKHKKAFFIKEINKRDSPPFREKKTGYISIYELYIIIEFNIPGIPYYYDQDAIEKKLKPFIKNEDMIKYAGNEDEIFEILFGDGYYYIPDNHPVRKGNDWEREGIEGYKDLKTLFIKEINVIDYHKTGFISIDELNFIIESVIQKGVDPINIEKLKPFIKDEDIIEYDGNEDEIFEILYGDLYYYIPENHPVRKGK